MTECFKQLESPELRKLNSFYLRVASVIWQSLLAPWRLLFAFVPPPHITHGWVAFICSLLFICGIAYIVTKITDLMSCVTGISLSPRFLLFLLLMMNMILLKVYFYSFPFKHTLLFVGISGYIIALTALASGTSWPDLVASKIAAERQKTADSAIANITCRFPS